MSKQSYIEMGFSNEDAEFIEKYPKLYPTASAIGLRMDTVDGIFNVFDKSLWIRTQTSHNSRQIHLKSIYVRLDNIKVPLLDLSIYKYCSEKEIEELVGKYNTKFMLELMKVIWNKKKILQKDDENLTHSGMGVTYEIV